MKEMFGGSPAFSSLGLEGEGRVSIEEHWTKKKTKEEIALIVFWQVPTATRVIERNGLRCLLDREKWLEMFA